MFDEGGICSMKEGEHVGHGAEGDIIATGSICEMMFNEVEIDPSRPIKRVYDAAVNAATHIPPDQIPHFKSVRLKLCRKRQSLIPPIPDSVADVVIEDEYSRTWDGEEFMSHLDNDWGISLFCTDANIRKLQRCDVVYIDGTFKTSPHPYAQFVTIRYGAVDWKNCRSIQTVIAAHKTEMSASLRSPLPSHPSGY